MKRLLCVLLAALLLVSLGGCNANTPKLNKPVDFYYCRDTASPSYSLSSGIITAEQRESQGYDDLTKLLDLYLQGPQDPLLRSPFPKGVTVAAFSQDDNLAEITLNAEFAGLSGYALTLACTCLAMTIMDLTQAETVQISAEDSLLSGNPAIRITKNQLIFDDIIPTEAKE